MPKRCKHYQELWGILKNEGRICLSQGPSDLGVEVAGELSEL